MLTGSKRQRSQGVGAQLLEQFSVTAATLFEREFGLSRAAARKAGHTLALSIRAYWGGQQFYVPKPETSSNQASLWPELQAALVEPASTGEEFLADVASATETTLSGQFAVTERLSRLAGERLSTVIHRDWGGQEIYILKPPSLAEDGSLRNQIRSQFTGRNHRELARTHGVSVQHIYRILRAEESSSGRESRVLS